MYFYLNSTTYVARLTYLFHWTVLKYLKFRSEKIFWLLWFYLCEEKCLTHLNQLHLINNNTNKNHFWNDALMILNKYVTKLVLDEVTWKFRPQRTTEINVFSSALRHDMVQQAYSYNPQLIFCLFLSFFSFLIGRYFYFARAFYTTRVSELKNEFHASEHCSIVY